MTRIVICLLATLTVHDGIAATLTGKAKQLWTEVPLSDVTVTVKTLAGTQLRTAKTDADGKYEIKNLPKKRVEISYRRDGWKDDPAIYPPILLSDGTTRHEGKLCKRDVDSQVAEQFGQFLFETASSSSTHEEELAILSRLSPEARTLIADAYAARMVPGSDDQARREARGAMLERFDAAYKQYSTTRRQLRLKGLIADMSEFSAARLTNDGRILVTVYDSYFEPGEHRIPADAKKEYKALADYLRAGQVKSIAVEGHADSSGPKSDNFELAQDRADSVRQYLITTGVSKTKMKAIGKGAADGPRLVKTATQYDRRVDLVLTIDKRESATWVAPMMNDH